MKKQSTPLRKRCASEVQDGTSSSDEADDATFAFLSALQADVESGTTLQQAVKNLFETPCDNKAGRKMGGINLTGPILSAMRNAPRLQHDVRAVAELCRTVYELAEDEMWGVRQDARKRLDFEFSSFLDVANMVKEAKRIVVLTGAGVSVSCGIPDFRSKGGVYDMVGERYGIDDPQLIFDLEEFKHDAGLFYSFAREVMPKGDVCPSATHRFVAELERRGKLLRNYSQNIDGLERIAGVSKERVVLCHGSFLTASCLRRECEARVSGEEIASEVANGIVPRCRECGDVESEGILKPDIVFFGEKLADEVADRLEEDVDVADLVMVLGTSLQVAPVAKMPEYFGESVPRILVNKEVVRGVFDVEILGHCDVIVGEISRALGWTTDVKECDVRFVKPRRFVFPGATSQKMREGEVAEECIVK